MIVFFFQAEDGIRDVAVTGVQTCALPIFIVVIAHGAAHGEAGRIQAGLFTDICECAIVIVVIELAWSFLAFERHLDADRKSTRLNSSHGYISYAVFCLKKKKTITSLLLYDDQYRQYPPA